jgi:hypothetical protein
MYMARRTGSRFLLLASIPALGLALPADAARPAHAARAAATAPYLAFSADRTSVASGETVTLSWAALNVNRCMASGDWSGRQPAEGYAETGPITAPASFTLTCYSGNVPVAQTVAVTVESSGSGSWRPADPEPVPGPTPEPVPEPTPEPVPEPTPEPVPEPTPEPLPEPKLVLQASTLAVRSGGHGTLHWTGEHVASCHASGAWSGPRPASGSEAVGPLLDSATYTLTCSGGGGEIVAMTSILVTEGGTQVSWSPPTERVDGAPLTDLAGYRIYVGTTSRDYVQEIQIHDASLTSYFVELLPGEYYFAMTALDAAGNESAYSNELQRTVR